MKNLSKKGFTLVELIVVITILAILGTIAFLNFGQYTQDAKDTKVTTDLQNIVKKIAVVSTDNNNLYLNDFIKDDKDANKMSGTFNSGTVLDGTSNYNAGTINFKNLEEDGSKFKDNDDNDYIYAYAVDGSTTFYQVAGVTKNAAGASVAKLEGHYYEGTGSDVDSLINAAAGDDAGSAVVNNSTTTLPY